MLEEKQREEHKKLFIELLKSTNRGGIDKIISWLEETDFFEAPASTRYHENYVGGLVEHSLKVYNTYMKLKTAFNLNIDDKSIIIMSLLHDVCKTNCYIKSKKNVKVGQNWITEDYFLFEDSNPIGHGQKSVILLLQKGLTLSELETFSIVAHMGTYDKSDCFDSTVTYNTNDLSIWLHIADFIATYKDRSKV